ncbi:MAG: FAD-linked oxidase C-terminal domain-containing protein [Phycisphaerales bacterium]|nr:FAD-linked oxidase C-terminal domain-containing protein [Phycisphaerales bacterium]
MQLPVLNNSSPSAGQGAGLSDTLAKELAAAISGHGSLRLSRHDRLLYATDASMYQVEPLAVVIPDDATGVERAVAWCDEHTLGVLPRGGGTSLAGQCTGRAVVIDTSASMRRLGQIEGDAVWAEAGCVIDEINAELARRAHEAGTQTLFFPPDPATAAQACVGGCIGNNASGSRSIKYGRTVDSIAEIDAVLSSGARVVFKAGAGRLDPMALKLAEGVTRIVRANERLIRERYAKTLRRNAGYALDMILAQLDAGAEPDDLDLTKLLCGSEGTLALTVAARLKLARLPKMRGLALVSFASIDGAIESVLPLLGTGVSAVELVDDVVIEAALHNIECREYVRAFPPVNGQPPRAVLYVEYQEETQETLGERLSKVASVLPVGTPIRLVTDAAGMNNAWKLRKSGEPLLHGLPGDRKPLTFVEDNAVPPQSLGLFVREFRRIIEREGTRAAFWAHASVGVLHVRPLLNPHSEADLERLQRIAVEAADLARACGGVMSGEHGDGRVRGPLLERFYGPELMRAFREVKQLFDPRGVLNPGNIVAPGPVSSIVERTRIEPQRGSVEAQKKPTVPSVSTYFEYGDHHGFAGAVERCNGAGVCRKQSGGTMCPSYRGTADERHSTRGRGNALRLAITGQLSADEAVGPAWGDTETIKTLDLCLSCKACKAECPSNVDIARLKAEYTAQRYKHEGRVPLSAWATGHVRLLNQLGSLTPGFANWAAASGPGRWLAEKVLRIDRRRPLPRFARSLKRQWEGGAAAGSDGPRVALFGDCFTSYSEPQIGLAARRVLEHLGYSVMLPGHGCCARSMISVGMLPAAIETIDATVEQLRPLIEDEAVGAILFLEPSCLSAVKDDWLQLKCRSSRALRERLAEKSMLVEQFIDAAWDRHPRRPEVRASAEHIALHAHCHQKALWGAESSAAMLRRFVGDRLTTLATGCCGMAGSFGYDKDKFNLSMAIARLPAHQGGVIDAIDRAPGGTARVVCATGTSCRHQIADATEGKQAAIHPIELIDRILVP